MARLPRLVVPGYPHHIIQRGNNRQTIFIDDIDRQQYLAVLTERAKQAALPVHAFVLMSNHVHLLVTPTDAEDIATVMQAVGCAYVRWFNKRHGRTGTLFEGRFKSAAVDTDGYTLACTRYIEMNPVRAGLVSNPVDYVWSSHRHNIGIQPHPLVTEHAVMWALGNTPYERQSRYLKMFDQPMSADLQAQIQRVTNGGFALGTEAWINRLAHTQPRRVRAGNAGRPKQYPGESDRAPKK